MHDYKVMTSCGGNCTILPTIKKKLLITNYLEGCVGDNTALVTPKFCKFWLPRQHNIGHFNSVNALAVNSAD